MKLCKVDIEYYRQNEKSGKEIIAFPLPNDIATFLIKDVVVNMKTELISSLHI
jgi:hypothetical protein